MAGAKVADAGSPGQPGGVRSNLRRLSGDRTLDRVGQPRVTLRLTPFARRALEALRAHGQPEGARPRPAAQVLEDALLRAYAAAGKPAANDRDERDVAGAGKRRAG